MKNTRELTVRVIILSVILTILLATSNAYLALKIGMLTSASIPAAILSMGILRFFKNSTPLENNLVQTAASAGEAVAGGIVYTIPALIMIHYWFEFSYWQNFWIALLGGVLGVLFSIPLRSFLVTDKNLPFPEGVAIAEILKTSTEKKHFIALIQGSALGGLIELFQTGFKVIASQWQSWWSFGHTIVGGGVGFSSTLIGAGYLIGFDVALSILLGAVLSWIIGVPVMSQFYSDAVSHMAVSEAAAYLWSDKLRYVAIGTMLTAGIGTMFSLVRPVVKQMRKSWEKLPQVAADSHLKDIPWRINKVGMIAAGVGLGIFFWYVFPIHALHLSTLESYIIIGIALLYVFIIGFVFSGITGYFSGLVGVSASPGSSVIIAGMLLIGFILLSLFQFLITDPWTDKQTIAAEAIAIIIGSIITGIACIANDNIQDLKVGYILRAAPWKQQIMLLLGVVVAALVIPPIMQILFEVYGIGDILPHPGMDPTQSLPAPPAAMMAALTQAVFSHHLPWNFLLTGVVIALILIMSLKAFKNYAPHSLLQRLSILSIGIGMYLPLSSSVPLFFGGLISYLCAKNLKKNNQPEAQKQKMTLFACGLVAGSAIMDVILAVPFAIFASPDILSFNFGELESYANLVRTLFGMGIWVLCAHWFKRLTFNRGK